VLAATLLTGHFDMPAAGVCVAGSVGGNFECRGRGSVTRATRPFLGGSVLSFPSPLSTNTHIYIPVLFVTSVVGVKTRIWFRLLNVGLNTTLRQEFGFGLGFKRLVLIQFEGRNLV